MTELQQLFQNRALTSGLVSGLLGAVLTGRPEMGVLAGLGGAGQTIEKEELENLLKKKEEQDLKENRRKESIQLLLSGRIEPKSVSKFQETGKISDLSFMPETMDLKDNIALQKSIVDLKSAETKFDNLKIEQSVKYPTGNIKFDSLPRITKESLSVVSILQKNLSDLEKSMDNLPSNIVSEVFEKGKSFMGKQSPEYARFESTRSSLINNIATVLGGVRGTQSDRDAALADKVLPEFLSNKEARMTKLESTKKLIQNSIDTILKNNGLTYSDVPSLTKKRLIYKNGKLQ